MDKPLARIIKKIRESTQVNKIRNKREVTTNITETQSQKNTRIIYQKWTM